MANQKTKVSKGGLVYKGVTYPLIFNLNTMEEIQEEYGTVDKWGELTDRSNGNEVNAKALKFGITVMLNEGVDMYNDEHDEKRQFFTEKQVGRIIMELGADAVSKQMNKAVIEASKSDEKNA